MRFYVTVNGGNHLSLSSNAGEQLKQDATANLRRLRIAYGYDYTALEIRGRPISRSPGLDLSGVEQRLKGDPLGNVVERTRLIISPAGVPDVDRETGFKLLISIEDGEQFSWNAGGKNVAATVCINKLERSRKLNATVVDIFQDIMLGNCSSIQAVLSKFYKAGKTERDFFELKARFAASVAKKGGIVFDKYNPDQYASFSSLARTDLYSRLTDGGVTRLGQLWTEFLCKYLSPYFLSVDEAIDLARSGLFHTTKAERVAEEGPKPPSRSRREFLDAAELKRLLQDPQKVLVTGSYILCVAHKLTGAKAELLAPHFVWKRAEHLRQSILLTESEYAKVVPLVRDGLVTPIRLFLKAGGAK